MTTENYLLDASALLTLIEDQAGADRVAGVIQAGHASVPWIDLLQVHALSQQQRSAAEADRRYVLLKELSIRIIWGADELTLLTASRLKAEHQLSLAEAITAALTLQTNAILIHANPNYDRLSGQVQIEALLTKTN